MSNEFSVYASEEGVIQLIKSSISSAEEVINHYDFVIRDISSDISDPVLEASKAVPLEFLEAMKSQWENFRDVLQQKLAELEKGKQE